MLLRFSAWNVAFDAAFRPSKLDHFNFVGFIYFEVPSSFLLRFLDSLGSKLCSDLFILIFQNLLVREHVRRFQIIFGNFLLSYSNVPIGVV